MSDFLQRHKLLAVIITGLLVIIIIGVFFATYFSSNSPQTLNPEQPTPIQLGGEIRASGIQKTEIGKTTISQIQNIPGITKVSDTQYTLPSELLARPNEILTDKNVAVFERALLPVSSQDPRYKTISEMEKIFGQPDKTAKGSKFYGEFLSTYIYASKGMTFIGNPNTNEVYEIQFFKPMTLDEYISKYGSDIPAAASPVVESH